MEQIAEIRVALRFYSNGENWMGGNVGVLQYASVLACIKDVLSFPSHFTN